MSGQVAERLANVAPRLWYGTPDAPAPDGVEEGRTGVSVVIGVRPAGPGNAVTVRYRVDGGPIQLLRAIRSRTDFERGVQYFRAGFPIFWSGNLVEYLPILSIAGRQVGHPATATTFPSSFRLAGRPGEMVTTRPSDGQSLSSARQPASRLPFTLDYLATATVPLRTEPEVIGPTPEGFKINWYPAPGGIVVGPAFRATVGVEGDHGMTVRPDGVGIVGVSVTVTTDDGALISVRYSGVLDFAEDAFQRLVSGDIAHLPWPAAVRITPRLHTAHPTYRWLNRLQCLGIGDFRAAELNFTYDLYAVR